LSKEALKVDDGWTVMIFSHDGPLKLFDETKLDEEPWNGTNSKDDGRKCIFIHEIPSLLEYALKTDVSYDLCWH